MALRIASSVVVRFFALCFAAATAMGSRDFCCPAGGAEEGADEATAAVHSSGRCSSVSNHAKHTNGLRPDKLLSFRAWAAMNIKSIACRPICSVPEASAFLAKHGKRCITAM